MKKGIIICVTTCVAAVLVTLLCMVMGNKLAVRDITTLEAENIVGVTVLANPPGKEATLGAEDIEQLVKILSTVTVYRKDNSYSEYTGQWVEFDITKTDGTKLEVAAYSPFLIINGEGYQAKYEPCQKLNSLANKIVEAAPVNPEQEEMQILVAEADVLSSHVMPVESETSENNTDLVMGGAVCDFLEMVMVKGKIYYGTGEESTALRCGVMDGQIDSTVGKGEMPTKDNESNFGTGYGYQYGGENTLEVCVDGKWWIFSCAGEDIDGVSEVDGQVDEADATAGTDEDEASDTEGQDTAASEGEALLWVTSDGHTAAAYEIFASSYSWSEHGWLCACGLDPATELSKIAEQLPEFTYSEDFAIELKANAQLLELVVYDKNFERLEAVTDLADLEPGKYYVCYGVEEKGRYIETEKQYEITTYYCVFELIFSMANAKIG